MKLYKIEYTILIRSPDNHEPSRDFLERIANEFGRMPGAFAVMVKLSYPETEKRPTKPQNQKRPQ